MKQNKNISRKKRKYSMKDYHSNDGMQTNIWGPPFWFILHIISFNYPISPSSLEKKKYKEFMLSLPHILPCGKCRENLKQNYKLLPLHNDVFKNRDSFSKYIYLLHEQVNKMLGKHSTISYCEVRDKYESFRANCKPDMNTIVHKGCVVPKHNRTRKKCILKMKSLSNKRNSKKNIKRKS